MIIKKIEIEKFRSFKNVSFCLGKRITAIAGRNATQKTTVLGMIGQPFTIRQSHPMYGCQTIDGYNFRSQFREKFKISPEFDIIGDHKWTLYFHNHVCDENQYTVKSIARKEKGKKDTLRFWNAESRSKGAGYIQIPVYYLSLSRLFPIGEASKTHKMDIQLSKDETDYCIRKYRTILSIQQMNGSASIGIEKGTASKTFTGISDDIHDIFTNSAGEGNITKIILAILSFKRLKEQYGNNYKGGILLIDEIDATLYGYSQAKLVEYLMEAAEEFSIQIVFTTHSPIILKSVNKFQRQELHDKGIYLPPEAYNSTIVYLEPQYDSEGMRSIMPRNIQRSAELNVILNDINLTVPISDDKLNIYCEDTTAINFIKFLLDDSLTINRDLYMKFIDINLGWSNYIQLVGKGVPEFVNNMIILDGDVQEKREYNNNKKSIVAKFGNILFIPLVIEKDLFKTLKNYSCFNVFISDYCNVPSYNYDICFNDWPLEESEYTTDDFKKWFKKICVELGGETLLYKFWIDNNKEIANKFVNTFIETFNKLADKKEIDGFPYTELNNYSNDSTDE